ncbi:hypothetical protein ASD81_04220 [Nocardioides sp. Root614]|nr:hypothetical protein ASD81_04220 [Nocardioides sp. Root614]KRA91856.1 hypothetical protein ASD84_04485 [Nocardioides sp. Root682]
MRDWSRQVLAHAVAAGGRRGVDSLVILGGLLDRSTALPATVDFAVQVLGSFGGQVVVVPGPSDWTDGMDLYALTDWAPNTTVIGSATFESVAGLSGARASAWTSPVGSTPRVASDSDEAPGILLRAGLTEEQAAVLQSHGRVLTSGPASEGVLTVPDLVRVPGTDGGWGLVIDLDSVDTEGERVELPPQPGRRVDLDVSGMREAAQLADALARAGREAGPVVVSLTGLLAPSLLLPGFGGPELSAAVVLDLSGLRYSVETPEASDRSTRAEFLRAMSLTRGDERERHQTAALGLRALDSSAAGA